MTKIQIFKELEEYLDVFQVSELQIVSGAKCDLVMCMTIADICRVYNSTKENEETVTDLLVKLCKIHFNGKGSYTSSKHSATIG